ncbi:MAG: rhamnogalacturonan acetylesterase [Verrucomicrobiaceae bacterium]
MKILAFFFFLTPLVAKPTLWIIGDSTVRNNTAGQQGWGDSLIKEFDPAEITVVNRAIGGRSSRSFITEGRWDAILTNLKEGDFVLMQFGHNDGGERFNGVRPRASIKGTGNETEIGIVETTGKEVTVHSYGWYIRKYCRDTLAKGATPIVASLIPRNIRGDDGKIAPDTKSYAVWAEVSAKQTGAHFIPFNKILAGEFNALPKGEVDAIFCGTDHTHTSRKGAAFNARILAWELRKLPDCTIGEHLIASLWLPHLFSDHMVLQRDWTFRDWGRVHVGSQVSVRLANQTQSTSPNTGSFVMTNASNSQKGNSTEGALYN